MTEDGSGRERLLEARSTRRRFLTTTGAAAALALTTGLPHPSVATARAPKDYPFRLGVASGDPFPDSVLIWTRLATDPLAPLGGMEYGKVAVNWQVAADEAFKRVIREGTTFARPEYGHSVHVEVAGLDPGREYHYRFRAGSELSPIGRTKTAPALGAPLASLSLAFASCQVWYEGFYSAYRDMVRQDLDVVFFLGDYIYEYGVGANSGVRQMPVPDRFTRETVTLDDYRDRYALYKSDADLQEAHASFPWIVTLDDHEVENNWADEVPEASSQTPGEAFLVRRANALRAYWENMPLRVPQEPVGPDMQLYRRFTFGDLAQISVLDTRQYRSDQAAGDGTKAPNPEQQDPARTITGDRQEEWLLDGMAASGARWNAMAQQTAMMQLDTRAGEGQTVPMDTWDGYTASRDRVLGGIRDRGVRNPLTIAGDLHRSVAGDLKLDFDDPDSPTVGAEFVGTSITSAGDGMDNDQRGETILAENPHVKFGNFQRGYVRCSVDRERWRCDYRVLPFVSRPGAEASTRASLVAEDGRPGVQNS